MRVGCPWRDIPEAFGSSNTIFKAFRRWSKNNKILKVFKKLIDEPDIEWIFMDASHVRAHQHSAGAFNSENQAISKSAGGNTSKIHLLVDAHGNPLEFIISDGTTHDVKIAPYLINLVENAFAKLKNFRGIATRFDKLKQSFESNVALACAYLWLKL